MTNFVEVAKSVGLFLIWSLFLMFTSYVKGYVDGEEKGKEEQLQTCKNDVELLILDRVRAINRKEKQKEARTTKNSESSKTCKDCKDVKKN